MWKRVFSTSLVAAIAGTAAVALAGTAGAARSPACTRGDTTVQIDPRGLLPLTDADPIGPAAAAALRAVPTAGRPQVVAAAVATQDVQRGPQAKYACGTRVWQRTLVVYVTERSALPAQSASQRVFFVGKFPSGYRVWQIVH